MSVSTSSGRTSVTGTVTVTGNSTDVALTPLTATNENASTPTTLGTVPAGKVWRIYGAYLAQNNVNQLSVVTSTLKYGTTTIASIIGAAPAASTESSNSVTVTIPGGYISVSAGTAITVLSGHANVRAAAGIYYIEVSA